MRRTCFILGLALCCAAVARSEDWAEFRGPHTNGVSDETNTPTTWGPTTNVKWKAELPGPGNSSPIVSEGRVFVTCAEDEGRKRSLYCFDRKDGKQLWVKTVDFDEVMPTHKTNPYCGSTPAADGQRVVVWHASAGLHCYDYSGKELWSRNLGTFRHTWGYGTSPIFFDGKIILHTGPGKREFVAAFNPETGATLWETEEPDGGAEGPRTDGKYRGSWSTTIVAKVDGQDQILCTLPTRLVAYDPKDGKIIWYCNGIRGPKGDLAYSSPMVGAGVCVAIGGYNGPSIGVKLGGHGDVTATHRLWRQEKNPQNIGTGVFIGDYLYRANAGPGTIECLDPQTGKAVWTDRGAGGNFWGSIVSANGNLYVTNQQGLTMVFKPNPEKFDEVARNPLGESSNSTPAVSDQQLFIRTARHVYCISD